MHRLVTILVAAILALSAVAGGSVVAGHEKRSVGPYAIEVGWLVEPAYLNTTNAVFLEVVDTRTGGPVDHLESSVQVEVILGGGAARRTLAFQVISDQPGQYQAPLIPTATGDYTFRIFGTIGSMKVDERFESGPGRFDPVVSSASQEFPRARTTTEELAERIDQVRLIAIAGLLVAVVALGISVTGTLRRRP